MVLPSFIVNSFRKKLKANFGKKKMSGLNSLFENKKIFMLLLHLQASLI